MATFQKQLERSKTVSSEIISRELFEFIKTVSDYMVELNKKQINQDGQDIYGKAIGFYSKATELITNGAKGEGEPFTGKDTGDWLDKFYVTVLDDIFFFGSSDPKTDDILDSPDWLSSSLFGLTDKNLKEVIETKFLPFVLKNNRQKLGL
jgi:uncharacterized protein (UPF0335 family)